MTPALPKMTSDIISLLSNSTNSKQERTIKHKQDMCCSSHIQICPALTDPAQTPYRLYPYSRLGGQCEAKTAFQSQQGQAQLARVSSNCEVHSTIFLQNTFRRCFLCKKGIERCMFELYVLSALGAEVKSF